MNVENIDDLISRMMRILSTNDLVRALSLMRGPTVRLELIPEKLTRLREFLKDRVSEPDLLECEKLLGLAE